MKKSRGIITLILTALIMVSLGYVVIWGIGTELCCQIKTDITFGEIPTKYSTAEIDKIV